MSGTVTISDQRSYIKIETLCGNNPSEIHSAVCEVCGEFRRSPDGPVSQTHSPHLHIGAPGIFPDLLRYVQMLNRYWGVEGNWMLLHLFNPL